MSEVTLGNVYLSGEIGEVSLWTGHANGTKILKTALVVY